MRYCMRGGCRSQCVLNCIYVSYLFLEDSEKKYAQFSAGNAVYSIAMASAGDDPFGSPRLFSPCVTCLGAEMHLICGSSPHPPPEMKIPAKRIRNCMVG